MPSVTSFPLSSVHAGRFFWAQGDESIRDVLWNILLTSPGERLMRPDFGAGLKQFIHQPNNETTRRLIADATLKSIQKWEPRITVLDLTVGTSLQSLNEVNVRLIYLIKQTGEENSFQLGLQLQI
jgi:uncharacterized protein